MATWTWLLSTHNVLHSRCQMESWPHGLSKRVGKKGKCINHHATTISGIVPLGLSIWIPLDHVFTSSTIVSMVAMDISTYINYEMQRIRSDPLVSFSGPCVSTDSQLVQLHSNVDLRVSLFLTWGKKKKKKHGQKVPEVVKRYNWSNPKSYFHIISMFRNASNMLDYENNAWKLFPVELMSYPLQKTCFQGEPPDVKPLKKSLTKIWLIIFSINQMWCEDQVSSQKTCRFPPSYLKLWIPLVLLSTTCPMSTQLRQLLKDLCQLPLQSTFHCFY